MNAQEFKAKIAMIYSIANELGQEYNISKCTPDGHLLGAIGQIAVKIGFGLSFGSPLKEHNCTWTNNDETINVQVRSTGRGSIALRQKPEHLIALEISETGKIRVLYNGPGSHVWDIIKNQKQPQKYATKNQLRNVQSEVSLNQQIPIKNNLFDA